MSKNSYEILGVSKNATDLEIKSAYKKLAKQYHPDVNKDPNAEIMFKEISSAYDDIKSKENREKYNFYSQNGGYNYREKNHNDYTYTMEEIDAQFLMELLEKLTRQRRKNPDEMKNAYEHLFGEKRNPNVVEKTLYMEEDDLTIGSQLRFTHNNSEKIHEIKLPVGCINKKFHYTIGEKKFIFHIKTNKFNIEDNGDIIMRERVDYPSFEKDNAFNINYIDGKSKKITINQEVDFDKTNKVVFKGKGYWKDMKSKKRGDLIIYFSFLNYENNRTNTP